MNSENQLYAVYSHTANPGDNVREGVRAGFNQAQALRWLEQDHGGLEVDHDRCAGIEVDQRQIPQITQEGTDIKLGTPIAAAVGPPYDNDTLSVTKRLTLTQSSGGPSYPKRVYFVGQTGSIYERESPHKKQDSVWGNGQLSGKYTASNDSSIVSFWYRNSSPKAQILAVLFQDLGKNSLSIASYRSNKTVATHWQSTEQSLQTQDGSALAMAPIGDRRDLRFSSLSDPISTRFDIPPGAPLSVSTQDNRDYFADITLPDCAKHGQPLTHLIIFPTLDKKSLSLVSWNCSSGFLDQTTRLGPLLQANRTYLGLANTMTALDPEDQRVYVVFDAGDGPEIEEWQVPPGAQNAEWKVLGTIPVVLT
ncbi:hypothetical protein EKO27_g2435 [Xylaria grammica]|uniref:Fucose-specific lectin n=1 Tax=Xylaria grammica TaxID=363999 RepID=A0A439DE21_9PEZI|nr:hypothetical protein EKO27_g2435 [Xylaria grammica]